MAGGHKEVEHSTTVCFLRVYPRRRKFSHPSVCYWMAFGIVNVNMFYEVTAIYTSLFFFCGGDETRTHNSLYQKQLPLPEVTLTTTPYFSVGTGGRGENLLF